MDVSQIPTGCILGSKYELLERIGQGASARVFKARQLGMSRDVAVKVFRPQENVESRARVLNEVSIMAQLRHPNTVTVYDHGDEGELLYLVMEHVSGGSLRGLVKQKGALDAAEAVDIILAILGSLQEAHHIGLLHLDIKPENILLSHDFSGSLVPKVSDFGISRWIDEASLDSTEESVEGFSGTPRYCSPEQIFARPLSQATDIYNVGLVLWYMLQGAPAVSSKTFKQSLLEHLSRTPWQMPESDDISEGLRAITHKALLKSPEYRYQSCAEMIHDLKQWQESSDLQHTISLTRDAIEFLIDETDQEPWMFTPQDIIDPNVESMVNLLGLAESSESWLGHRPMNADVPPPIPVQSPPRLPAPAPAPVPAVKTLVLEDIEPSNSSGGKVNYTPGHRPERPQEAPNSRRVRSEPSRFKVPLFQGLYGWMALSALGPVLLLILFIAVFSMDKPAQDQLLNRVPAWKQMSIDSTASSKTPTVDDAQRVLTQRVTTPIREVVKPSTSRRFSSAGLLAVLKSQGWSRGRATSRDNLSSYTQQNFLYNKDSAQLDVTIYEVKNKTIQDELTRRIKRNGEHLNFDSITLHLVPTNTATKLPLEDLMMTLRRYRTLVTQP